LRDKNPAYVTLNPLRPPPKGDSICPLYERGIGGFVYISGRFWTKNEKRFIFFNPLYPLPKGDGICPLSLPPNRGTINTNNASPSVELR